jgi:hypothetical protein
MFWPYGQPFKSAISFSPQCIHDVVARERFGLSSAGPKPAMLGRYTTGLHRLICGVDAEVLRTGFFLISILACREKRFRGKFHVGLKQYRGHCGHSWAVVYALKSMVSSMPIWSCSGGMAVIIPGSLAPFLSFIMPTD